VLDVLAGDRLTRRSDTEPGDAPSDGSVHVTGSISVMATPEEAYAYWRQLENLPLFMNHLEFVQEKDRTRSHCIAKGPAGTHVEWDAEITDEVPNERISWRSLEQADVENSGTVRFIRQPGDRGTMIEVEMRYKPPLGGAGAVVAKLFGEEPSQQLADDLRRQKQLIETGEIPTTDGQPAGPRTRTAKLMKQALNIGAEDRR